ncbi:MAG: hypothetical protein ACRCTY_01985, partial [Candidatus Adiutrix sp.]
ADLVLSLNEETDGLDGLRLRPNGLLLAFSNNYTLPNGAEGLTVPYDEMSAARERNMAALGIVVAALGLFLPDAQEEIRKKFKNSDSPLAALEKGYAWGLSMVSGFKLAPALEKPKNRLLINGNRALALGALAGGIKFCAFYP